MNAILLHKMDNVVTVTETVPAGGAAVYFLDGIEKKEIAVQEIPQFHKIALSPIARGEAVIKYGETIGYATRDILRGQHVHTQNMDS